MTEAEIIAALNAIRTGSPPEQARNYAVGLLLGFLSTVGHSAVVTAFFEARERVPFDTAPTP